jgi:hypothetical protein
MQGEPRTRNGIKNTGSRCHPARGYLSFSLRKKRYWQGTLLFSDRRRVVGRSIVGLVSGGHTDDEKQAAVMGARITHRPRPAKAVMKLVSRTPRFFRGKVLYKNQLSSVKGKIGSPLFKE